MTIDEYLNLIPSANRQKPKFVAMCTLYVALQVHMQNVVASLVDKFNLETAEGDQLDILGAWVGISRNVSIPITGIYFSWDDVDTDGWDIGVWAPSTAPTTITTLPDDSYRILIKAKIATNKWDGTTDGAYEVWESVFTDLNILIQDYQDMSYDLIIVGHQVDAITLALITGGYLPLKPEGVRINNVFVPIDDGPVFGWDLDNEFIQGWDEGSWAIQKPVS